MPFDYYFCGMALLWRMLTFLVLHYSATIPLGMVCIRTADQLELIISTTEAQRCVKLVLQLYLLVQPV
jgi:hypothetical protein